jgi:hypothetical protein
MRACHVFSFRQLSYRSSCQSSKTERCTQHKVGGSETSFKGSLTRPLLDPDRRLPGRYEPAIRLCRSGGDESLVDDPSSQGTVRSYAITLPAQEVTLVPKNRASRRSFWLIATRAHGRMEVLTIAVGGETVLPIFSFQEEVELFLSLQANEAVWWPRETTTGELASLLLGLCARVEKVALDPLPGFGEREIIGLVSTGRRRFMRYLMGEDTAHPERKNPSRRETRRYSPTPLRRGRMGFAKSTTRNLPRANETLSTNVQGG